MPIKSRRKVNEKKFPNRSKLPNGGRRYWLEVKGKHGWKARYIKEVNGNEETVKFFQEVYGSLIEVHEKFPLDKGHRKTKEG